MPPQAHTQNQGASADGRQAPRPGSPCLGSGDSVHANVNQLCSFFKDPGGRKQLKICKVTTFLCLGADLNSVVKRHSGFFCLSFYCPAGNRKYHGAEHRGM